MSNLLLAAIRKPSPPAQTIKVGEWEIPIVIDPTLGPNTVEFRHPDGRRDRFYADPYLDIIGARDIQTKINRVERGAHGRVAPTKCPNRSNEGQGRKHIAADGSG